MAVGVVELVKEERFGRQGHGPWGDLSELPQEHRPRGERGGETSNRYHMVSVAHLARYHRHVAGPGPPSFLCTWSGTRPGTKQGSVMAKE